MRTQVFAVPADKGSMRGVCGRWLLRRRLLLGLAIVLGYAGCRCGVIFAQGLVEEPAGELRGLQAAGPSGSTGEAEVSAGRHAAGTFLRGRTLEGGAGAAGGLARARAQHAAMAQVQGVRPRISRLDSRWQPVGPNQVASPAFGRISGRVSSIAIDPADRSGNTVYVGTTGGGVWKSINAAGAAESVTFVPLTDELSVFSASAGSTATASLSIGAISAQAGGIVLAGTGDPNDASDSYYGSGLLRSADGGLTWGLVESSRDTPRPLYFGGLGFAGFAWSTSDPGLVVAAVSDAARTSIVNAPLTDSVRGLYVSHDAGVTWYLATISDGPQTIESASAHGGGLAATSVVWNPVRKRFYAALRYHGYYESLDGASWTRLASQPGAGLTAMACPPTPGTAGSASCPIFRGALAVQPVSGDMFALTTDRSNVDQGLWEDVCGVSGGGCASSSVRFATRLDSGPMERGGGSTVIAQADYNLGLAAVASGTDTLLFAATRDLYRCSVSAGCVFRNTTNALNGCAAPARVAPAQHAIATLDGASLLYLGNDSGLWRSTDGVNEQGPSCSADDASHFDNLNGGLGSLAEVISFAQDPQEPLNLLVGLGASGTARSSLLTTASVWDQISAGEGGTVAIDQSNPLLWYISTAGGVSLRACSLGARCGAADFAGIPTIGAAQTNADASVLDAPWILDPALSANVLVGTCRVWRGPAGSGDLWSGANRLSTTLGGPENNACDPTTNAMIRSLAAGGPGATGGTIPNSGSKVLYAGMAGAIDGGGAFAGHVFTTANADLASSGTRWMDVSTSLVTNGNISSTQFNPGAFDVSSLVADAHDATGQTVYATVMGFTGNGLSIAHVYASTDGGAHWLNITSNLPNAPANSIVVDPNDANTVYVAMDTGVYVTTGVANCSQANCWSIYGRALPNAPVVQLAAAAQLPTGDGRVGLLRAGTYGRGIWEVPLVTAAFPAQPAISLSRSQVTFADQAVGTISDVQTITVTNTGAAPLAVSRTAVTGDFTVTNTCVGKALAINASCAVQVQFLPSAQGNRGGVLTIYGNVSGGQATATLSGVGTPPGDLMLSPLALSFPTTTVNGTSAAQNITISNTGGSPVTLGTPAGSSDFNVSANTCGASLAPSTGCTVSVVFAPTAAGARSGTLTVQGASIKLTASLTGTAVSPATDSISPGSLAFALQQIGSSSATQQVVLTNAGDVPLTLITAQISSGDFTAVNGCGNSLNARSSCAISVAYVPNGIGVGLGELVIADQFRSQVVSLAGTGVAPPGVSLSPSGSMSFPTTAIGVRSAGQAVTLTNNGGLLLSLNRVALSGDFSILPGGSCATSLAPGSACTFLLSFMPSMGGSRSGLLSITDDAPNSPQSLALAGTGVDFSLAADGSTSATVASGKAATFPLLLSSIAGMAGQVKLSCAGAPPSSSCVVFPGSVALGSTTVVTVTVATGVTSTAGAGEGSRPATGSRTVSPLVLAGLLPIGAAMLRRRNAAKLMGLLMVFCVVAGGGCGVGRVIPVPGGPTQTAGSATPAGEYTLTVTAASSGLTRAVTLKLTVQ